MRTVAIFGLALLCGCHPSEKSPQGRTSEASRHTQAPTAVSATDVVRRAIQAAQNDDADGFAAELSETPLAERPKASALPASADCFLKSVKAVSSVLVMAQWSCGNSYIDRGFIMNAGKIAGITDRIEPEFNVR
jgi:hypothetical protein